MTDTPEPSGSGAPADPAAVGARTQANLEAYLTTNGASYTEEALRAAARTAGYPDAVIDAAFTRVTARAASAPVRARARSIVLGAYLITFLVLTFGMATSNAAAIGIAGAILAVTLGIALAISLWVVRRSTGHGADAGLMVITGMLAVPMILLVIVAGLCVATGLPFNPSRII